MDWHAACYISGMSNKRFELPDDARPPEGDEAKLTAMMGVAADAMEGRIRTLNMQLIQNVSPLVGSPTAIYALMVAMVNVLWESVASAEAAKLARDAGHQPTTQEDVEAESEKAWEDFESGKPELVKASADFLAQMISSRLSREGHKNGKTYKVSVVEVDA